LSLKENKIANTKGVSLILTLLICYFHPPLLPSPATAPPIPFCEEEINKRRGKRRRVVEGQKKKANYQAFNAARPRAESTLDLEKSEFSVETYPITDPWDW